MPARVETREGCNMYRAMIPGRARPRCLPALLAGALLAPPVALAAKTDVVVLRNGDRITGEVQELSYGQLKYKTDDMGTIYIEWDKIRSLTTKQILQVELLNGGRYFGPAPAAGESMLVIEPTRGQDRELPIEVPMTDVVRIGTLEAGNWYRRLDGAVSFGFSYTQATDVAQSNFSGNFGTRTYKRKWDVALDWNTSSQSKGPSSERASLTGTLERFLPNRYYYEGQLGFTQNDELGLDLRSQLSGTFGRYLMQRQGREWRAGAGLAVSREDRSDGSRVESIELPLTTSYRVFRLDSPKTNVDITLTMLPSLTESGRVRGEADISARQEIIKDLFFEISLYDSYDNQAPEGSKSNDWNVVTSLGYSF
jgi:hypothetical protein